jgi:hypothetical protein
LKKKYSYTINGLNLTSCSSPLCPKAFYHLVKVYHFVKEGLESEAFIIVSDLFGGTVKEAFGPIQPEEP